MEQIFPDNWLYIHYDLIMSLAVAQILGVYMLGDSTHPTAGLELYTVYFVAPSWAGLPSPCNRLSALQ